MGGRVGQVVNHPVATIVPLSASLRVTAQHQASDRAHDVSHHRCACVLTVLLLWWTRVIAVYGTGTKTQWWLDATGGHGTYPPSLSLGGVVAIAREPTIVSITCLSTDQH